MTAVKILQKRAAFRAETPFVQRGDFGQVGRQKRDNAPVLFRKRDIGVRGELVQCRIGPESEFFVDMTPCRRGVKPERAAAMQHLHECFEHFCRDSAPPERFTHDHHVDVSDPVFLINHRGGGTDHAPAADGENAGGAGSKKHLAAVAARLVPADGSGKFKQRVRISCADDGNLIQGDLKP